MHGAGIYYTPNRQEHSIPKTVHILRFSHDIIFENMTSFVVRGLKRVSSNLSKDVEPSCSEDEDDDDVLSRRLVCSLPSPLSYFSWWLLEIPTAGDNAGRLKEKESSR